MNSETMKATMIEQFKEMCEDLSKAPLIEEPVWTYLGPFWDINAVSKRRFVAGKCAGALKLLKQVLTDEEYEQLKHMVDDAVMKG